MGVEIERGCGISIHQNGAAGAGKREAGKGTEARVEAREAGVKRVVRLEGGPAAKVNAQNANRLLGANDVKRERKWVGREGSEVGGDERGNKGKQVAFVQIKALARDGAISVDNGHDLGDSSELIMDK